VFITSNSRGVSQRFRSILNQRCILNSMSALPGVAEFSQFSPPAQAFLARMNACRWLGKPQFLVCLIEAV